MAGWRRRDPQDVEQPPHDETFIVTTVSNYRSKQRIRTNVVSLALEQHPPTYDEYAHGRLRLYHITNFLGENADRSFLFVYDTDNEEMIMYLPKEDHGVDEWPILDDLVPWDGCLNYLTEGDHLEAATKGHMWSTSNDQEQERFAHMFKLLVATLWKVNKENVVDGLERRQAEGIDRGCSQNSWPIQHLCVAAVFGAASAALHNTTQV